MPVAAYRTAFTDWLACACAGAQERAARAVRASGTDLLTDVAFAATAGHVLDFDDTLPDGVVHVSATAAPAALVLAAHLGRSLQDVFAAFAEGLEATAAVACAGHPSLYDRGWHPSAVCGPIGAAVAAARLLELTSEQRETAVTVALLRAGGSRGAFGSDGKAIQVGLAAAAGVQGALVARGGASVDSRAVHGPAGFAAVLGVTWPSGDGGGAAPIELLAHPRARPAIERNWIKLHDSLPQWGAVLKPAGADAVRVDGPRGAPGRPITEAELAGKVSDLAGDRLDGVLDDSGTPARHVLRVAGLSLPLRK